MDSSPYVLVGAILIGERRPIVDGIRSPTVDRPEPPCAGGTDATQIKIAR